MSSTINWTQVQTRPLLMIPGPTELPFPVIQAMNQPPAIQYDRTFDEVPPDDPVAPTPTTACGGGVIVDRVTGTVDLEPGVRIDLGGIGKGYAADRALALLSQAGPAMVDAGGDVATHGRPDSLGWRVGVETAHGTLTIALEGGAVATSGRDRRHWRRVQYQRRHHRWRSYYPQRWRVARQHRLP